MRIVRQLTFSFLKVLKNYPQGDSILFFECFIKDVMKIANICQTLSFFLLVALGNSSSAGEFTARVSAILFYEQGDLIYVFFEGGTKNRPACAGSNGDYISFSMKRPRAREYLSGLMLAYASGKSVAVTTAGACVDQSVSDTLNYFMLI